MNETAKAQLTKALQKELIRRSLIRYFQEKGYDNFLKKPYPPALSDLPEQIMFLGGVVEVDHHLEDINIQDNTVKLDWNVFVLGNKRIYLGSTIHDNLTDVDESHGKTEEYHDGPITIEGIIKAIVEFLGESSQLSDIYKRSKLSGNDTATNMAFTVKPYKPVPDLRRRV